MHDKQDELFSEMKKRLQQRLGMNDKEWQKVKCGIIRQRHLSTAEVDPIDKGKRMIYIIYTNILKGKAYIR